MNYLYFAIDICAVVFPFAFSFHPKIAFYKKWKYAFPSILFTALLFIIWDIYFTGKGVWGFTPAYLSGYYFFNLPVEEVLFFICIPYACLFTYYCLKSFVERDYLYKYEKGLTFLLLAFLISIVLLNTSRIYTCFTFFGLISLILILKFFIKPEWLSRFYFSYLILLIPFSIVNGILTGSYLKEPVVWYNNNENLGIRLRTIPIEDVFYGLLLILLNTAIFEYLKNRKPA